MTLHLNPTREGDRRTGGMRRVTVLVCLGLFAAACQSPASDASDDPGDEVVAAADAYWQALADGDAQAAMDLIDPAFAQTDLTPFGRADSLEGQMRWYEAVGVRWISSDCVKSGPDIAECTASVINDWSEALDVEPVTGTFLIQVGEAGIMRVSAGSFDDRWGPEVFEPFEDWVRTNHPEDAAVMWGPGDVNDEILDLFAVNTQRFVDAQG